MKNIYLLSVISTLRLQRLRGVKAKASIALLIFIGIATPSAFSQKSCDTLVAKDGRRIGVEIIRSNSNGLLYTKCSETTGQQYFMKKDKILEIRKPGALEPPKTDPPPPKTTPPPPSPPSIEKEVLLKDETDLSKPKTIVWAGLAPLGLASLDYEANGTGYLLFGAEMGFKDSPLRLGLILHPVFLRSDSYYDSFEKNGVSGEIGLVFKSFTHGRLSGRVSNAYWGIELRSGRQAYTYSYSSSPNQQTNKVKYTWTSLMPRLGFQLYYEMFAFDVALPIGYQFYRYSNSGSYISESTGGNLTLQPCVSLGLRF